MEAQEQGRGAGKVAIVGLGASGRAAARLALEQGGEVYVSDLRVDATTAASADELRRAGADVELGSHDQARIAASQTVVASPGIPPDAPVLRALGRGGVGWISEPEFAFRFLGRALIAVTGTNGKTTTAALTAHLLEHGGVRTGLGGNIGGGFGPPASELALLDPKPDWFVLEMSSFQLAGIRKFSPDVGVVTNLAPDHLDRYASVSDYYGDKARLFENATEDSRWVLNHEDDAVLGLAGDAAGARYGFGAAGDFEGGHLADGELRLVMGGEDRILCRAEDLSLLGRHNALNALAAAVAASLAGVETDRIGSALRTFPALPHRLEPLGERAGVMWVNDSKATNVAAARSAIASLDRPVVVLLGGWDKGEDFADVLPAGGAGVKAAVAYGQAGPRIAEALGSEVAVTRSGGSFADAVRDGARLAGPGDALLLAPACSSFDMFEDYEARGRAFTSLFAEAPDA